MAAPVYVAGGKATAKAAGLSTAKTIEVEVSDPAALLRWILLNEDRTPLVKAFDMVALKSRARNLREGESIPGLTVSSKSSIRVRG